MTSIQGERFYVRLGASQVRRRLKGRGEAVIFHTATGQYLRELRALFQDLLAESDDTADERVADVGGSRESGQPS